MVVHPKSISSLRSGQRAIRNIKVKLKVSGQFKSEQGAKDYATLRSIVDTARKRASDGVYANKVNIYGYYTSGATSYKIYRVKSPNDTKTLLTTTGSYSYYDTSAVPSVVYYYYVQACNSKECGEYSPYDTGYIEAPLPTPSNIYASDGIYKEKVHISSYSVKDATSYKIYRATSPNGIKRYLTTTLKNSYDNYGVAPETTYYYFVQACNWEGCSGYSKANSGYAGKNFNPSAIIYLLD